MEPRFCMQCGSKLQPGQRFCDQCGLVVPDTLPIQSGVGKTPVIATPPHVQAQSPSEMRSSQNDTEKKYQSKKIDKPGDMSPVRSKNATQGAQDEEISQSDKKYRLPQREKSHTAPRKKKYRLPLEQTPGSREMKVPPVRERRVVPPDISAKIKENKENIAADTSDPFMPGISDQSPTKPVETGTKTRTSDTKRSGYISSAYRHLDLDDIRLSPLYRHFRVGIIIGVIAIIAVIAVIVALSWTFNNENLPYQIPSVQETIIPTQTALFTDTNITDIKPCTIDEVIGEYNDIEQNLSLIEVRLMVDKTKEPFILNPEDDKITVTVNEREPVSLMTPEKTTLYPGTSKLFGWDISTIDAKRGDQIHLTITTDSGEKIYASRTIPDDYDGGPLYED